MKTILQPLFSCNVPGPWGVNSIGATWYVVNSQTGVARAVGKVGAKKRNYFDAAIALADSRNRKLNDKPKKEKRLVHPGAAT